MPVVGPDPTGTAATQTGEVGCHSDLSVLDINIMVPVGTGDVRLSTGPDPKDHRASSPRKRKSHPTQESSLVVSVHSLQSPLKLQPFSSSMSDYTDNNELNPLASLSPEKIANIKAFLATQQSSTTVDLPRTKQLVITDDATTLIPSISGEHFFFPPDNPDDETISPNDLLFDKNPLQQYTAPGWDLPFSVDRSSPYHHFEQALVKIIE
ncbi:hypothetical protein BGX30_007161 [Mortierella sp. GBA39]|nr:hypothetical protein BGX30_007161 [Mortierella sp. GBA39]